MFKIAANKLDHIFLFVERYSDLNNLLNFKSRL
ncbi:MAG: hypothetical protein ACI9WV_001651 [Patiriisocius sp.]|jgi:hypothetical protein